MIEIWAAAQQEWRWMSILTMRISTWSIPCQLLRTFSMFTMSFICQLLVSFRFLTKRSRWSIWLSIWSDTSPRSTYTIFRFCKKDAHKGRHRTICHSKWVMSVARLSCWVRWSQEVHLYWPMICVSIAEICCISSQLCLQKKTQSCWRWMSKVKRIQQRFSSSKQRKKRTRKPVRRLESKLWRHSNANLSKSTLKSSKWPLTTTVERI